MPEAFLVVTVVVHDSYEAGRDRYLLCGCTFRTVEKAKTRVFDLPYDEHTSFPSYTRSVRAFFFEVDFTTRVKSYHVLGSRHQHQEEYLIKPEINYMYENFSSEHSVLNWHTDTLNVFFFKTSSRNYLFKSSLAANCFDFMVYE